MGGRVVPGTQSNRTSEEIYSNRADQVMSQWPGRARARCASKEKTLQNSLRLLLFILLLQPQPFRWDLVGTQIMRHPWEFELEFPLTWSSWLFWPHEEKNTPTCRWIHTFHDHWVLWPHYLLDGLCVWLLPHPYQAQDHLRERSCRADPCGRVSW